MRRSFALMLTLAVLNGPALAQMTEVPGPGGIPIAPGAPARGYTPGGIGPGGTEVAPGRAARDVPMYRTGPGGIVMPARPDPRRARRAARRVQPCRGGECEVPALPQTLAVTISSRDAGKREPPSNDKRIDSIDELFAALRGCWDPPAPDQSREGQQMSVRFSFRRNGELMAPPFVTYTTPGTDAETKKVYRQAIESSLKRCTSMPFSKSFSAAIAGQPISVRFVDDRDVKAGERRP